MKQTDAAHFGVERDLHSTISEPVRSQGNELLQAHNFALRGDSPGFATASLSDNGVHNVHPGSPMAAA